MPPDAQAGPIDPFAFARAVDPQSAAPEILPLLLIVGVLSALFLRRTFEPVGLTTMDAALLAAAPFLATREAPLFSPAATSTVVAMNFAGFLIPLLLSVKWLLKSTTFTGSAVLWRFVVGVTIVTAASYLSSHAIPNEGVLLYYRIPALLAALTAVALFWGSWHEVGPFAYAIGATGVIIGADVLRLNELITDAHTPHHIVLGGAGVLDGIFLVSLLALTMSAVAASLADHVMHRLHASETRGAPA